MGYSRNWFERTMTLIDSIDIEDDTVIDYFEYEKTVCKRLGTRRKSSMD